MEVHGRLRPAGRARRERDHRHVVGRGRHAGERRRACRGEGGEVRGVVAAEGDDPTPGTAASSAVNRWSHSASWTCAISQMLVSSAVRSIGIVATATPPALSTPSQQAASHGLLGPRSSTRFPPRARDPRSAPARPGWPARQRRRRSRSPRGTAGSAGPGRARRSSRPAVHRRRSAGPDSAARPLDRSRSGHCPSGGRLSRQNVSVCAEGESCMSGPSLMPPAMTGPTGHRRDLAPVFPSDSATACPLAPSRRAAISPATPEPAARRSAVQRLPLRHDQPVAAVELIKLA